ncbi:hypothetical protein [Bradyrhizobium ivorense]|uniref:hypothetical protein n=1 Tax=Bradyrhizobium ivorense TaxID=2511166 RepID=UPI001121AF16|nr:hypothetical protein [Bradyrhizobium ivorense]
MRYDLSVDDPLIEHALNRNRLSLGDDVGVISTRSEVDQCAAAAVFDDEQVAEDLSHVAPDCRRAGLQPLDRGWP